MEYDWCEKHCSIYLSITMLTVNYSWAEIWEQQNNNLKWWNGKWEQLNKSPYTNFAVGLCNIP